MNQTSSISLTKRGKILLPITLDRWRSPISTLLRACAVENPQFDFYSFSNPPYEEDRVLSRNLWASANVHPCRQLLAPLRKYDVSHIASLSKKNVLASRMAKVRSGGKAAFLVTINLELEEGHPAYWNTFLDTLKHADHFVAVSETVAKFVKPYVGDRFRGVIPNGFDPVFYDPSADSQTLLPQEMREIAGEPFVLYVSALEPRKRPDVIL